MLGLDFFIAFFQSTVVLIYGLIALISMIFTFDIDSYLRLDEKLNLNLLLEEIVTPVDRDIVRIDDWLISNNKIIGPLLIILSLIDIVMLFKLIYFLL